MTRSVSVARILAPSVPVTPIAPRLPGLSYLSDALARLRLAAGDARPRDKCLQRVISIAVMDAAASDDQRLLALANPFRRPLNRSPASARLRGICQTRFSKKAVG